MRDETSRPGQNAHQAAAGKWHTILAISLLLLSSEALAHEILLVQSLAERTLPENAALLFARSLNWRPDQGWGLPLAGLVALQFTMIVGLLIHSARQRKVGFALAETARRSGMARTAAKVGVWQWNLETDQVILDGDLKDLLGYDASDSDNAPTTSGAQIHPEDWPIVHRAAQEHARGLTSQLEVQHRLRDKDGNFRWFLTRGQAISGGNYLTMTAIDITDRKQAEDERASALLQLEEQRNELAHLSRAAITGALSGAVAHELNQPLSAMMSNARAALHLLAKGGSDQQEMGDILADIESDGRRAGAVIRHLREFLRRGEGEYEVVQLEGIVDLVLRLMHSDLVEDNIKVVRRSTAEAPLISGHSVQLQQVLLNLLTNACDALKGVDPHERSIQITTTRQGDALRTSICDNGCGLPDESPERFFKPFVTTKQSGLGLGLSISRSIINAHGGRLWAENNPDAGATFHVELPAVKEVRVG